VRGLPLAQSEALLDELWSIAVREEFTWHNEWRVGDLVLWDNRCTMHRRDPFARKRAASSIGRRSNLKRLPRREPPT